MNFYQPHSLAEAVQLGGDGQENLYLAGGTDLILQMKHQLPKGLIDLGHIPELKKVVKTKTHLYIGSMTTFNELAENSLVKEHAKALWHCTQSMGSVQIRNQATLGGNLANLSPAADSVPPLLALDAEVILCLCSGVQRLSIAEFLDCFGQLSGRSLIRGISIPLKGLTSSFYKLGRREALAIARLSVAFAVKLKGERVGRVKIAFGAVSPRPFLALELGKYLSNRKLNESWVQDAKEGAQELVTQVLGGRATAPYKRIAVAGVVGAAICSLVEGGIPGD
jgi:CO/xanthine dehydrogenase FAD-binding subunit